MIRDLRATLNRRRSERVLAQLPVVVKGTARDRVPFTEPTRTVTLNAHGALITLTARAELGQILILANAATQEEQECCVVYLGARQAGRTEVGIAFKHAAPRFWGLDSPPADWKHLLE